MTEKAKQDKGRKRQLDKKYTRDNRGTNDRYTHDGVVIIP